MTTMTDIRAVEIVTDAISNEAYEKAQPALQHIAARLLEPVEAQAQGGGEVYWANGAQWPNVSPPSAPVGVDSIEANDSADYIELCASRLESLGKRVMAETLRAIAAEHRALAQQSAAVVVDDTRGRAK